MDTAAFVTSLVTSLIIFLILLLVHILFSRSASNYPVYYPALLLRGSHPEEAKLRGPLSWLQEAWRAKEQDIISFAGLDAAVYIKLQETALKIFGFSAIFCIPVLVTVSALSNGYKQDTQNKATTANSTSTGNVTFGGFDKLAMGNIPNKSNKIWIYLAGAYWLSIVTYFVLWKLYDHIVRLRNADLSSPKARPEQFAVLVRDIRSNGTSSHTEQVDTYFRKIHPDTYETCIAASDLSVADKLWRSLQQFKSKLARCNAGFETSEVRPQHKTGMLGLFGPKVDSIDFYKEKIRELKAKHSEERNKTRGGSDKQQAAAIVVFNSRTAAAAAGQCTYSPVQAWKTYPAPEPREVVWENLHIGFYQRMIRRAIVYTVVTLTILFYMIPIGLISALTTLDNLKKTLPFIKSIVSIKALSAVLQAYLPQLALIVFLALLPSLLLYLSKLEGIPSQAQLERAAAGKYFYFNVFNVFLGITLASSLFGTIKEIQKDPGKTPELLGKSIPPSASFFITFIALKLFVGSGLRLSRLIPLIIFRLKKKYMCKTEDEVKVAWTPKPFSYATNVPSDMLIFTISMCYAVIAPMVLPFAIVYFAFGWILSRHEALKVVVPAYESSGRMWPHIHNRILSALLVSQLAMLGYFGVKQFVYTVLLVPLPIATIIFAFITHKIFYGTFKVIPLETASVPPKELPTTAAIVDAYTPTCLVPDDDKFEDAHSTVSGKSSDIVSPV